MPFPHPVATISADSTEDENGLLLPSRQQRQTVDRASQRPILMSRSKSNGNASAKETSTATIGFKAELWLAADIHHLAPPRHGRLRPLQRRMSSNQSGEGDIRRALIEADLVDCLVALPGQFFYSTQIPVCLWFLAKNKAADAKRGFSDRRQQTPFIDARKLGTLISASVGNASLN